MFALLLAVTVAAQQAPAPAKADTAKKVTKHAVVAKDSTKKHAKKDSVKAPAKDSGKKAGK